MKSDTKITSTDVYEVHLGVVKLTWVLNPRCLSLRANYHSHCCLWLSSGLRFTAFIIKMSADLHHLSQGGMAAWDYLSGSSGWIWHFGIPALSHCGENTFGRRAVAASQIHSHPFKFLSCSAVTVLLYHLSKCRHSCFGRRRPFTVMIVFLREICTIMSLSECTVVAACLCLWERKWNRKGARVCRDIWVNIWCVLVWVCAGMTQSSCWQLRWMC